MKRLSPTRYMRGLQVADRYDRLEHLGLAHEKLAPHSSTMSPDARSAFIRGMGSHAPVPKVYAAAFRRWVRRTPRSMGEQDAALAREVWLVRSGGRVLCGLGEQTPTENGLSIHQTYGVPYLPGSSLKGITKRYLSETVTKGAWRPGGALFEEVFGKEPEEGDEGLSGGVHFLDALWVPADPEFPASPFAAEILTPHHGEYYKDKAAPDGTQSPIPVTFLAAQGAFRVVLEGQAGLLVHVRPVVQRALAERGIGAKSRSGYGRFASLERLSRDDEYLERERQEREEAQRLRLDFERASTPAQTLAALGLEGAAEEQLIEQFSLWITGSAQVDPRLGRWELTPQAALETWTWTHANVGLKGQWKKLQDQLPGEVCAHLERELFGKGEPSGSAGGFGTNHLDSFDLPPKSKKKAKAWPNKFAQRIARGSFDEDTVRRAIAHLLDNGGRDGHVKVILEAYGMEE